MSLTYGSYLKVDKLMELQQLQSKPEEHDEMLFIIIHQTYELWFKEILHEMGRLRTEMEAGRTWTSVKTLRRILTIMKTLVGQVDILETMTPLEFNSFRGFLDEASGFQSVQFRELEILCGYYSPQAFLAHEGHPQIQQRLKARRNEHTLWESYCRYLQAHGYDIPEPQRINDSGVIYEASPELQETLVALMQEDPQATLLTELLVDFDEGLQEWRYRHVKMVERTIGNKMGTGGSDGVNYLRKTLHRPIFPDLWAIRSKF